MFGEKRGDEGEARELKAKKRRYEHATHKADNVLVREVAVPLAFDFGFPLLKRDGGADERHVFSFYVGLNR